MRSEEQIDDHIEEFAHSLEMPFESILSCHFIQFEKFIYEKQTEKVVQVHEACCFDDDPIRLDEMFTGDLVTHTPPVEHVGSCCEDGYVDDELLLQEKFEEEFNKFCEKIIIEKFSSNYIEKIKHTEYNCEDAYMDDEPLFLELFKNECDYSCLLYTSPSPRDS